MAPREPGQVKELTILTKPRASLASTSTSQSRHRSGRRPSVVSPFLPKKRRAQSIASRVSTRVSKIIDDAEEMNARLSTDEVLRQAFDAGFTGPGVREKHGDRFKTTADRKLEASAAKMERALKTLHVDGTQQFRDAFRRQRAEELRRDPNFGKHDTEFGESAPRRRTRRSIRPQTQAEEDDRAAESDDGDIRCLCKASTKHLMVQCDSCDACFHPGCIGKGAWNYDHYINDDARREGCWRTDFKLWKQGKHYLCHECTDKRQDDLDVTERDITERDRRTAKREADKPARIQKPLRRVKKRATLRAAKPKDERREEVDQNFAGFDDEDMDVDRDSDPEIGARSSADSDLAQDDPAALTQLSSQKSRGRGHSRSRSSVRKQPTTSSTGSVSKGRKSRRLRAMADQALEPEDDIMHSL